MLFFLPAKGHLTRQAYLQSGRGAIQRPIEDKVVCGPERQTGYGLDRAVARLDP